MKPAFLRLVAFPPPTARPLRIAGPDGAGARRAADRWEASRMELVDRDLEMHALGDDVAAAAAKQRRDLDQPALGIPLPKACPGALAGLARSEARDPDRSAGKRAAERLELAHRAAGDAHV